MTENDARPPGRYQFSSAAVEGLPEIERKPLLPPIKMQPDFPLAAAPNPSQPLQPREIYQGSKDRVNTTQLFRDPFLPSVKEDRRSSNLPPRLITESLSQDTSRGLHGAHNAPLPDDLPWRRGNSTIGQSIRRGSYPPSNLHGVDQRPRSSPRRSHMPIISPPPSATYFSARRHDYVQPGSATGLSRHSPQGKPCFLPASRRGTM